MLAVFGRLSALKNPLLSSEFASLDLETLLVDDSFVICFPPCGISYGY